MKQFKKLALCLLAAVLALGMFAACGRTPLDIKYDEAKQQTAEAALSEYMQQTGITMAKDATMMKDAKAGLEPAVAYLVGKLSKNDSAMEIYMKVSMDDTELQACYNEHRFIKIVIPEAQYSQETVLNALKSEMQKVNAAAAPTQYGISVGVYEDTVYVAMFMK